MSCSPMSDEMTISDRYRMPVVAQRRDDIPGGVVIRTAKSWLILNKAEFDRLVTFVRNEPRIQRYATS